MATKWLVCNTVAGQLASASWSPIQGHSTPGQPGRGYLSFDQPLEHNIQRPTAEDCAKPLT